MSKLSKVVATVSSLTVVAAIGLASSVAQAQYIPAPPVPPEYLATSAPVYYEGHAAYWYGNQWRYRDEHGAWQGYRQEPSFLRDRRMHPGPAPRSYGRRR